MDFSREINLIGKDKFELIKNSKVAVFGIGGVGGYIVEGLVRLGVEHIVLFDGDVVDLTNFNRQIIATTDSLGMDKVEVAKQRCLQINPNCHVSANKIFVTADNVVDLNLSDYNFVFDAIDTVSSKVALIEQCKKLGVEIISCMGTGNKLNPTMLEVSDVYKTSVCPLAKIMRKLLREKGIKDLKVVYSKEEPVKLAQRTPASISFLPSVAGFIMVSEFFKYVIK